MPRFEMPAPGAENHRFICVLAAAFHIDDDIRHAAGHSRHHKNIAILCPAHEHGRHSTAISWKRHQPLKMSIAHYVMQCSSIWPFVRFLEPGNLLSRSALLLADYQDDGVKEMSYIVARHRDIARRRQEEALHDISSAVVTCQ